MTLERSHVLRNIVAARGPGTMLKMNRDLGADEDLSPGC